MFNSPKNLMEIQRNYLKNMCKNVEGLKCMIFDKQSSQLVSLNFLQSEGFEMEVFLFEDIENIKSEKMNYVSAIYILSNPFESLKFFQNELKNPNFKEYHIYFLQDVTDDVVRRFAEYDEQDLIKTFQRIFCSYFAINKEFFHSNVQNTHLILETSQDQWDPKINFEFLKIEESIMSCLCSLRIKPQIRYLKDSKISEQIADRISNKFSKFQNLNNEFKNQESLLLIIDRKEDPFTPLLISWSYQALLHEFIGINMNKIISKGKDYNLNQQYDSFYSINLFSNYGELAKNLQNKMEKLSKEKEGYKNMDKFEDMQKMLASIQTFQKEQALTQQHFSLTDDLSNMIKNKDLLNISQLQQKIVAKQNKKESQKELQQLIQNPASDSYQLLILVCLFILKFEDQESKAVVKAQFLAKFPEYENILKKLLKKCGNSQRVCESFKGNFGTKALQIYNDFFGEQQNKLELHVPLVIQIIDQIFKGKLSEQEFPFIENIQYREIPETIIIYVVGGVTFQEAKTFGEMNKKQNKFLILGGTNTINSKEFFVNYLGENLSQFYYL